MCNGGDISGLRKGPASVVVRVHFPNNNSQLIFDPNNNTQLIFDPNNNTQSVEFVIIPIQRL